MWVEVSVPRNGLRMSTQNNMKMTGWGGMPQGYIPEKWSLPHVSIKKMIRAYAGTWENYINRKVDNEIMELLP